MSFETFVFDRTLPRILLPFKAWTIYKRGPLAETIFPIEFREGLPKDLRGVILSLRCAGRGMVSITSKSCPCGKCVPLLLLPKLIKLIRGTR